MLSNLRKNRGKCIEKCNFYIKCFNKIKCYADRPYLVFSELKPETHCVTCIYLFFSSGKIRKNEKSQGIAEFSKKKFIVYRLLKCIISINCKRFMVRNITFII